MVRQRYNKAEIIYKKLLKKLSPRFKGKIVAVEPDSKEYVLGSDELDVALEATRKFHGKKLGFFRVGYPAVHKVRNLIK